MGRCLNRFDPISVYEEIKVEKSSPSHHAVGHPFQA